MCIRDRVTVLIYDPVVATELWQIEQGYLEKSDTIDPVAWSKRPAWRRLLQNVARLFDALM